jgi:hypothetical protein
MKGGGIGGVGGVIGVPRMHHIGVALRLRRTNCVQLSQCGVTVIVILVVSVLVCTCRHRNGVYTFARCATVAGGPILEE